MTWSFCLSFSSPAVEPGIQLRSRPLTLDTGKVNVAVCLLGSDFSSLDVLTVTLFPTDSNATYENPGDGENLPPAGPTPGLTSGDTHTQSACHRPRKEPHQLPVCSFAGSGYVNDESDRESDGYMWVFLVTS